MYVKCGTREIGYLKSKDKRLGALIDQIGPVRRPVNPDLFSSLIFCMIGQQISGAVQRAIWRRLTETHGRPEPETYSRLTAGQFRQAGMSLKKAENIVALCAKAVSGELDLGQVKRMPDSGVIQALTGLNGIGVWTAEMILIFSLRRPDVLSFGDLGIHRGMRMVYRRRVIDRAFFERVRRRLSPCGSAASLYFWEVAGGALPGLKDPAPKKPRG